MREIKFRGKINKLPECNDGYPYRVGDWIYGFYVKAKRVEDGKRKIYHYIYTEGTVVGSVDPETVGQFIDSHDKNGKEIYEGDIFGAKERWFEPIVKHSTNKGGFIIGNLGPEILLCDYLKDNPEFEIIGNIYENPELLEDRE